MTVIKVPKTPKRAFDRDRLPSALIQAQIEHLETASGAAAAQLGSRRSRPGCEGDAAEYIAQLTAQLHPLPGAPPDALEEPSSKAAVARTRTRARGVATGRAKAKPRAATATAAATRAKAEAPAPRRRKVKETKPGRRRKGVTP